MDNSIGIEILDILSKINEKFDKIDEKFDKIDEKFNKIDERFDKMEQKYDEKFEQMDQKFNELRKELMDKMFVFEHEYGSKIDAIYDAVLLEKDKNMEKTEKIKKLDKRVEMNETNIFGNEKRISVLELNSLKESLNS